jgi:hypothetical protein
MTSQYQWAKDKLKQFDQDAQDIRAEIDRLYALLARKQEARLQFHEMVEREFGAAAQTVVMQDMRHVERRNEEAHAQLAPPSNDGALSALAKYGEAAARKRERDRENYHKRKAGKQRTFAADSWSAKALAYLKGIDEPVSFNQIALHHGVRDIERARLRSALARLKMAGLIGNPPGEPQGTGHHATYLLTGTGITRIASGNGADAHP